MTMSKALNTRRTILEKAFELIYKKGYQTTSINEIIATTEVTKGAFFYHFKTKDEIGIALINEIIKPTMYEYLILPLQNTNNPIEKIYLTIKSLLFNNPILSYKYGCPLGNLIQEMSPWNSEFTVALNLAIKNDNLHNNVNPKQVAQFILSSYWGIRSFSKISDSNECYHTYLKELKIYLANLKYLKT
jgi:TetR/AcrR family transcriptional repressor of nem operon